MGTVEDEPMKKDDNGFIGVPLSDLVETWAFHQWLKETYTDGDELYQQWVGCDTDITLSEWIYKNHPHIWVQWRMSQ